MREAGFRNRWNLKLEGTGSREEQVKVKDALLKIADEKLLALMRPEYVDVVRACLTCLDDDESGRRHK